VLLAQTAGPPWWPAVLVNDRRLLDGQRADERRCRATRRVGASVPCRWLTGQRRSLVRLDRPSWACQHAWRDLGREKMDRLGVAGVERLNDEILHPGIDEVLIIGDGGIRCESHP